MSLKNNTEIHQLFEVRCCLIADGAKPGDIQVFHRQGNPNNPWTDGSSITDPRLPLPWLGVERFEPGGAEPQRHHTHPQRDARN